MDPRRVVLGAVCVQSLSGCMVMGGIGHMGGGAISAPGDMQSRDLSASVQHAEASSGGLTIALSFPSPTGGDGAVPIDAWLITDTDHRDLTDGVVWLLIQTPTGGVDRVDMQLHSSSAGTYRARYRFTVSGSYLVTAEGRSGTGADMRTVSVTTEATVEGGSGGRDGWVTPVAVLGGLGMVVMMALMMVNSAP